MACNASSPNQLFQLVAFDPAAVAAVEPPLGRFMLRARGNPDLCMYSGFGDTGRPHLKLCDPSDTKQVFAFNKNSGQISLPFRTPWCLEDGGASAGGFVPSEMCQVYCDPGSAGQKFGFRAALHGTMIALA